MFGTELEVQMDRGAGGAFDGDEDSKCSCGAATRRRARARATVWLRKRTGPPHSLLSRWAGTLPSGPGNLRPPYASKSGWSHLHHERASHAWHCASSTELTLASSDSSGRRRRQSFRHGTSVCFDRDTTTFLPVFCECTPPPGIRKPPFTMFPQQEDALLLLLLLAET